MSSRFISLTRSNRQVRTRTPGGVTGTAREGLPMLIPTPTWPCGVESVFAGRGLGVTTDKLLGTASASAASADKEQGAEWIETFDYVRQ